MKYFSEKEKKLEMALDKLKKLNLGKSNWLDLCIDRGDASKVVRVVLNIVVNAAITIMG